ncbi:MAG: transposase [Ignavibacteria bacterium]|nr:transposase [Ignavibacteria bacterium]
MGLRGRKYYDKLGNTYFITSTILGHLKVFKLNDKYCDILVDSLKYLLIEHSSHINAYVIMPNHIHFVLKMQDGESISDFMRDFKRHTSKEIKKLLIMEKEMNIIAKLTKLSGTGKYKLWMDRFDDVIITTRKVLDVKINYIHYNPVRAGLVEKVTDWKYSSARNYYCDDDSIIKVERNI